MSSLHPAWAVANPSAHSGVYVETRLNYQCGWSQSEKRRVGARMKSHNWHMYSAQSFCVFKSKDYFSMFGRMKTMVVVHCSCWMYIWFSIFQQRQLNNRVKYTSFFNCKNNVFSLKKIWKCREVHRRKKNRKKLLPWKTHYLFGIFSFF